MRILLIGKHGQLGHDLLPVLMAVGEVRAVGRETLDLENLSAICQLLKQIRPTIIVNTAAYTAVDRAEIDLERANAINGIAPTVMAEVAQNLGSALIHISTDYVFDGKKNTPYLEDDITKPINAYGQSKLLGEQGVRQMCDRHAILRTAWVYGANSKGNFVKTMLRLGAEREEVSVVMDQVGCPTWTGDLAQAIAQFAFHLRPDSPNPPIGIYHYTNSGAISWYDFAVAIFEEAALMGFPLKIQRVIPISSADYPSPTVRPAYSVLSGHKTSARLGSPAPYWRHSLRQMLKQLSKAFYSTSQAS
ncbi:dTDP-4-dehydrorhamnose reductase [Oscillatoria sp. FACHB-1407]|uniref:dTDP-4-dehydrorhamnose reductase n=1 Tax=Oscillatoria sp. FACHB-1407 TaxID=2692847 RepID=UPI0016881313|nr:dTDP-4-dehydrorhamnose reductase [Oscillatoria sp. FACHB-1407]MBD2463112.1 dTDP-4-dehydrorhamnose reductase [Oscillatoria sp. FACHB-1407]